MVSLVMGVTAWVMEEKGLVGARSCWSSTAEKGLYGPLGLFCRCQALEPSALEWALPSPPLPEDS